MGSTRDNFIIVYVLVVTLVVISFLVIRKSPRAPTKLKLGDDRPQTPKEFNDEMARSARPSKALAPQNRITREKSLNVMFNWNGHSWDAYEVLGVPAGASPEAVREAFQRARATSDAESTEFLRAALAAIERSLA